MADGSIWKKEIKLRKQSGPSASTPTPPPAVPDGGRPVSIWKREFRLRKPVELAYPVVPAAAVEPREEEVSNRFDASPLWDAPEPRAPFESQAAEVASAHGPAAEPEPRLESLPAREPAPAPEPEGEEWEWAAGHEPRPVADDQPVFLDESSHTTEEPPAPRSDPAEPARAAKDETPRAAAPGVAPVAPAAWYREAPAVHEAEAAPTPVAPWSAGRAAEPVPIMPPEPEEQVEHEAEPAPPAIAGELDPVDEPTAPELTTVAAAPETAKASRLKRDVKLPTLRGRKTKTVVATAAATRTAKNLVGLRVGSSQLAAACVHNNGGAELVQLARVSIPHGIVSGGEVRDVESLTRELKAFFALNKLPRRGVRLGIASNRIGVRVLEVPKLDDPKLFENSIRFHAQETLPIAVTDAILDHVVLGEGAGQGLEPTVRVLLVFAHRELVERHVEACRRAGLKLEGIDFEAFALLRALAAPPAEGEEPSEAVVALAVGNERTIFAVSDGRTCDYTRVLEWGGGSVDVAIARALNLTPSQAEPIKLALALDGDAAPSQLSPEQVDAARSAIRTEIQTLARELVSSLQFYQAREGSLDIGSILLSGGGAHLAGFAGELERTIGVPVKLGDPLARVELGRKVGRPAEPGSLAVAIGLGIED